MYEYLINECMYFLHMVNKIFQHRLQILLYRIKVKNHKQMHFDFEYSNHRIFVVYVGNETEARDVQTKQEPKRSYSKNSSTWSDWGGKIQLLQLRQLHFSQENDKPGVHRKTWAQRDT